jgi:hypothetical protein
LKEEPIGFTDMLKVVFKPGVVVHTYNSNTWEAKAEGLPV